MPQVYRQPDHTAELYKLRFRGREQEIHINWQDDAEGGAMVGISTTRKGSLSAMLGYKSQSALALRVYLYVVHGEMAYGATTSRIYGQVSRHRAAAWINLLAEELDKKSQGNAYLERRRYPAYDTPAQA